MALYACVLASPVDQQDSSIICACVHAVCPLAAAEPDSISHGSNR